MVIVHDQETRFDVNTARLRAYFGLTGAEVNVAKGVMQGKPFRKIADEYNNSVVTTRNLLKRVLSKTGVHRQS